MVAIASFIIIYKVWPFHPPAITHKQAPSHDKDAKKHISVKKRQNVFESQEKVIILHPQQQKSDNMRTFNAYYYFYFYFANCCEAGNCV